MRSLRDILMPRVSGSAIPSAILWTSLSGSVYAAASFVLLMLASNWTGAYWAGALGLGLAMSQQLYTLGNFSMGGYQASDAAERSTFPQYVASRVITVAAMFPVAAAWIWAKRIDGVTAAIFLVLLAQRASEAFCSVLTGRYQQKGRLDVGGRIEFAKNLLSLAAGVATLWFTRGIIASVSASAIVHIALFFALDRAVLPDFGGLRSASLASVRVWRLLADCAPLALTTFLLLYIQNGPRFAIADAHSNEALAYFNALFMVSFAISTFASFILNPHVSVLGEARERGDGRRFFGIVAGQFAAILALGAVALACALTFAPRLLSILFGLGLDGYGRELGLLVAGGTLLALYQLAQTVLIVLRCQGWTLAGVLPATLFTFVFAARAIGAEGADPVHASSLFFVEAMAILFLSFLALAAVAVAKRWNTPDAKEAR